MSQFDALWSSAAALAIVAGCSCGSEEQGAASGGSGGDASSESAGGAGSGATGGASGTGGAACLQSVPDEVPAGWVRFPGLPCACDVWMAPNANLMGPAPGWITTEPGVLELENSWADEKHRIFLGTELGDSWQGKQYLAYLRDLGGDLHEAVVARLPDNVLTFQARMPKGFLAKCSLRIPAMNEGVALFDAWESGDAFAPRPGVFAASSPPGAELNVVQAATMPPPGPDFAVSSKLAAWNMGDSRIDVMHLDGTAKYDGAWKSSGTLLAPNAGLFAWSEAVFFELRSQPKMLESWIWEPIGGAQPLAKVTGSEAGSVGSSCGIATDGKQLVWTQASSWNGSGWDQVDVMTAPFTTDPSKLQAKKLRTGPAGIQGCVRWLVQAGRAATVAFSSGLEPRVVIVDLADGKLWEVPNRPGRYFGRPLYITDTEVAMAEALTLPNDAGLSELYSWSIVRYPLVLLGPGVPP